MSVEYRFLRFESAGLSTILYLTVVSLPLASSETIALILSDITKLIALMASLFLFSLPLGYLEHQIVVNKHRSHKMHRKIHDILSDTILDIQKSHNHKESQPPFFSQFDEKSKMSFLTDLFDLLLYYKKSEIDPSMKERLDTLWSHFYARKAVGLYAPIVTTLLYLFLLFLIHTNYVPLKISLYNLVFSLILLGVIWVIGLFLIDSYSTKIWHEINYLEMSLVMVEFKKMKPLLEQIVVYIMDHPKYITKKGDSLGWGRLKLWKKTQK